jgi:CubicO group peptidase (beta-lactamase class C family)
MRRWNACVSASCKAQLYWWFESLSTEIQVSKGWRPNMKITRPLIGIIAVLSCLVLTLAALAAVDWSAEYLGRTLRWGPSDIYDYQKFPERVIENAPPTFYFKEGPAPELFSTIQYKEDGGTKQANFDEFLRSTGTTAFIVIEDDTILYENYFNGNQRDSIVTSFSSAKSVNSALIGIAIDEGLIGSVDDPVVDYIPEIRGRGLDELTIKHLLDMSSGIAYLEDENMFPLLAPFSDDAKTYYYPDLRALALTVQAGDEPLGEALHYNNYHPLLEGLILERATGQAVAVYLQEKIWKPLGMEFPASWSLDSVESGFEKMESGINARAIDFAKFGRLFLKGGNWEGKQIISEDWVAASTVPDPEDNRLWVTFPEYKERGGYYQYHWWGLVREDGHYEFSARGHLGQYIYVCPQTNLVIVRYGKEEGPGVYWEDIMIQLEERIAENVDGSDT